MKPQTISSSQPKRLTLNKRSMGRLGRAPSANGVMASMSYSEWTISYCCCTK